MEYTGVEMAAATVHTNAAAKAKGMEYLSIDDVTQRASVGVSRFTGASGVQEYHVIVRPDEYADIETQLGWMQETYQTAIDVLGIGRGTAVFRRFLLSDIVNQQDALRAHAFSNPQAPDEPCAISWVGQPPAPPARAAMWAYHVSDPNAPIVKSLDASSLTLSRGPLSHHWSTRLASTDAEDSYTQTQAILSDYEHRLQSWDCTVHDNLIRTWLFVQNVDANYKGLVTARREFFTERGLTADTHYIASTGIEGTHSDVAAKVLFDAYAIAGVQPEQIEFISALDHLSHTHVYGVTFERATSISYRDRKHVLISGTASIDKEGQIVHPGDVSRQLDRTLENVEALLSQAGATLSDMCHFIVYVRDHTDCEMARRRMRERFATAPIEVVVAPVCRPGWLIEVEGMAVIAADNPNLPEF